MRSLDAEPTSNVPEGIDKEKNNGDFEVMASATKVALSRLRIKLQKLQRIYENVGEALPTIVVDVVELAR